MLSTAAFTWVCVHSLSHLLFPLHTPFFSSLCSQHKRPQITTTDYSPTPSVLPSPPRKQPWFICSCQWAGGSWTQGWARLAYDKWGIYQPFHLQMLSTCSPESSRKLLNSKHIQASADTGNERYECFPARSRLELKPTPRPGTFYSYSWNYLACLLYPQPSVMGWAGRDKLSNQKIEGSISGCDNLIRQLIYINICTAWWCRWAFAYFFFLDAFWQAGGECRALRCQGEILYLFYTLSLLLCPCGIRKGRENNPTIPFLPFSANSAAMPVFSGKPGRAKRQYVKISVLAEQYDCMCQHASL